MKGRQFDKNGNANPWWDSETVEKFTEKAQCFIDMYDNYTVPELFSTLDPKDAHVRLVSSKLCLLDNVLYFTSSYTIYHKISSVPCIKLPFVHPIS